MCRSSPLRRPPSATLAAVLAGLALLALLLGAVLALPTGSLPTGSSRSPAYADYPGFTVNSVNDPGDGTCDETECTLREAINDANSSPGTEGIWFNISGPGPHTISPGTALPTIDDPVIIDGYTQTGASPNTLPPEQGTDAVLKIELDGSGLPPGVIGLKITAGDSTVRGLVINRFDGHGVWIETDGGNVIEGNFIGTNADGDAALGNSSAGVYISGSPSNTIGGTAPGAANVISGNYAGVAMSGEGATGNRVLGNFIGTNPDSSPGIGNVWGVAMHASGNTIGGGDPGAGNVISGNTEIGVYLQGPGATANQVLGNYIGTDAGDSPDIGNYEAGVSIYNAWDNTIGGTGAGEGNTIAYNGADGVEVGGASAIGNTIRGNSIHSNDGMGINNVNGGNTELTPPTITSAGSAAGTACIFCDIDVFSDGADEGRIYHGSTSADGGGNWTYPGAVSGPNVTATATDETGNTSEFSIPFYPVGFVVDSTGDGGDSNPGDGACDDGSGYCTLRAAIVEANHPNNLGLDTIQFDIDASSDLGCNAGTGVCTITPGPSGLPTVADPVIIDGYTQTGASPNTNPLELGSDAVLKIELDGSGAGVGVNGLHITAGNSTVRGLVINRFDESDSHGVFIDANGGNVIEGNFIGTDVNGMADLGNRGAGVSIDDGPGNTIGGTTPGARNVISGNGWGIGIVRSYATGNQVQGNYIGTDVTGSGPLGNSGQGVGIGDASANIVGGTTAAARNVISANGSGGVIIVALYVPSTGNQVQGNYIGTQADGASPLGNGDHGVAIYNTWDNAIGGLAGGAGNTIAYNSLDGVRVEVFEAGSATGNTIRGNSIHSNGGLGIDNVNGGNTELTPPVITAAGSASGTACADCDIDVFSDDVDEGRIYHGSTAADGLGDWSFPGAVSGPNVTATATDGSDNTSEFSEPFAATTIANMVVTKTDTADPVVAGDTFSYTITATNMGPGPARGLWILDALPDPLDGDGRGHKDFVSASVGIDTTGDTVPDGDPLPCFPEWVGPLPNPFPPPVTFNNSVVCSISPTLVPSLLPAESAVVTITVSTLPSDAGIPNANFAVAIMDAIFGELNPSVDPDPSNESPDCDGVAGVQYNLGCELTDVLSLTPTPTATATSTPTPTPTVTTAALKIGALLPLTGELGWLGPGLLNAAELAASDINEAGGVLGGEVQIVPGDTETDAVAGVTEAVRLIAIEGVDVIVGAAASVVTVPVAEDATVPNGILQISPASTSPFITALSDDDLLFRTALSDAAQGKVLAELAVELEYGRASTLYIDDAYGQGLSDAFVSNFVYLGGEVLAAVPHAPGLLSYADELEVATAGGPDVLVAISYAEDASVYLAEAIYGGLIDEFLFVDGTRSQEMIDTVCAEVEIPECLDGMYGTAHAWPETPAGAAFDAAYFDAYGESPEVYAREAYDAVILAALAAETASSSDPSLIRDALRGVSRPGGDVVGLAEAGGIDYALEQAGLGHDIDYEGASGCVDFGVYGDVTCGWLEIWYVEGDTIVAGPAEPVVPAPALVSVDMDRTMAGVQTTGMIDLDEGPEFSIDVYIDGSVDPGLQSFSVDVVYDNSRVDATGVLEGPFLASNGASTFCSVQDPDVDPDRARLTCTITSGTPALGEGVLGTIKFNVVATPGGESLSFVLENISLADAVGNPMSYTPQNGTGDVVGVIELLAGKVGTCGFNGDGAPATDFWLCNPHGVFKVVSTDSLYVADTANNAVRRIHPDSPDGELLTVAGRGSGTCAGQTGPFGDGCRPTEAILSSPWDVFVDIAGNLYIADEGHNLIRKVEPGADGVVNGSADEIITTVAGGGSGCPANPDPPHDGCAATEAVLQSPRGVAADPSGNVFIADTENHRIRKVEPGADGVVNGGPDETITTVAGTGHATGSLDGEGGANPLDDLRDGRPATSASLNSPHDIYMYGLSGNFILADTLNHRIRIVDAFSGVILTFAGSGFASYGGDNGLAILAHLNGPEAIAVDSDDLRLPSVLIADTQNHCIRRVNGRTSVITTVAGTCGESGSGGDGGAATLAHLYLPAGIAVGSLTGADTKNSTLRTIDPTTGEPTGRFSGLSCTVGSVATADWIFVVGILGLIVGRRRIRGLIVHMWAVARPTAWPGTTS